MRRIIENFMRRDIFYVMSALAMIEASLFFFGAKEITEWLFFVFFVMVSFVSMMVAVFSPLKREPRRHHYFVVFLYNKDGVRRAGNSLLSSLVKLDTMDAVHALESDLSEHVKEKFGESADKVVLVSWKQLKGDGEQ